MKLALGSVLLLAACACRAVPAERRLELSSSRPSRTAPDPLLSDLSTPLVAHVDQDELRERVAAGEGARAFELAFDAGTALFETRFTAIDGGGANVGDGQRYTRVPRADLDGPGEWASHFPPRATGPNAQDCSACHNAPANDGSGFAVANVVRDPGHAGRPGAMVYRNPPHAFGVGALQRLAEEMTAELRALRSAAEARALAEGCPQRVELRAKGVDFGVLRVAPGAGGVARIDASEVRGLSPDLVVRPFQWKGSVATLREFSRNAFHDELGMQGVELVGEEVDGDGDGVTDELTVGDVTAMAVYLAAQPRPTTRLELSELGLLALAAEEVERIQAGRAVFEQVGCAVCHVPVLALDDPLYREPALDPAYRDARLPSGEEPGASGLDVERPLSFDLTRDQPDNRIVASDGRTVALGSLHVGADGRAQVELYGDLKRHDMGPGLAESIDEVGTGASVFQTENLWGVGSTAPYLHDGRATTLAEAILAHGGDAQASRDAFAGLALARQRELLAFLENLVLFLAE